MSTYLTFPLPYAHDSQGLMSCLATLEYPIFLDSGSARGADRRFDILAAEPVAWIQITAGAGSGSDPDIPVSAESIFSLIKQLRLKYIAPHEIIDQTVAHLPFQSGLLGYLGYPALQGRAGFLIKDAFVGAYRWAVIVDHDAQRTTLVVDPGYPPESLPRLLQLLAVSAEPEVPVAGEFRLLGGFEQQWSRSDYEKAFRAIKTYISAGDCYQVNLTQQFVAACSGHPFAAYLRLRAAMPAPFSAFIGWPEGALLSVSPERFLRLTGRDVLTQPIKGTRPRAVDPQQDQLLARQLVASVKDQAENLMIVDLLRNDLGQVCETGSIKADQLFTLQSYTNVHHLVSSIKARLDCNRDALDLLQACFPGGSITGAPKLRAMAIIQELEAEPRRAYCGTVFYLSANGAMDSSITIRSVLWEANYLHCWAGGGIVDDSEADAEYAECFDKIARIINSFSD